MTVIEVENEFTPFPYDPEVLNPSNRLKPTDRMYPVQDDNINDVPGHPALRMLTSAGEHTFIGINGSIEIRSKKLADGSRANPPETLGVLIVEKVGQDGRGVWDL
jgi:hypothetical protein